MESTITDNHQHLDILKLSEEEMRTLQEKCEQDDPHVREQIILAYLPYVKSCAKKYCGKGVPYDDLYQEGCYGLIKAVNNYRCKFNTSFITYFSIYIHKYMKKAIISQNIFFPIVYKEHFFYDLQKYLHTYDTIYETELRPPTKDELADKLGFTQKKIQLLQASAHMFLSYPFQYNSFDMLINTANSSTNSAEETYFNLNSNLDLKSLGVLLTVREREVLTRKLGFTKNRTAESTDEISSALGVSRETIRITYLTALKKIKEAIEENEFDKTIFDA